MEEHRTVRAAIMITLVAVPALAGTARAVGPMEVRSAPTASGDRRDAAPAPATEARKAKGQVSVRISPLENERVGVGMPIQVFFSTPITGVRAKQRVERHLTVRMSERVWGAWYWIND